MGIKNDTKELVSAGIITAETGEKIENYFNIKKGNKTNKLFLIFGVLGSILIGLGIILLLAHNWDNIPKAVRVGLSFLPLIIGQLLCAYTLIYKKSSNYVWRECSAAFLFLAVGANIALLSQVYQISGSTDKFLFTWIILALPLIYIMRSSIASILAIALTTICINIINFDTLMDFSIEFTFVLLPLILIALTIPHYILLRKNNPTSGFLTVFQWAYPISGFWLLSGVISDELWPITFLAYFSLLAVYFLIGKTKAFRNTPTGKNGFLFIGWGGVAILLFILSFQGVIEEMIDLPDSLWRYNSAKTLSFFDLFEYSNFVALFPLIIIAMTLMIVQIIEKIRQKITIKKLSLMDYIIFIVLMITSAAIIYSSEDSSINKFNSSALITSLINIFILAEGLIFTVKGVRNNKAGTLNLGLLLLITLISCRFFGIDLGFTLKGIFFILLGAGFLTVNVLLSKKRKQNALLEENKINKNGEKTDGIK